MRQAETLFFNATILTMDPSLPRTEALLARGGRIAAVGPHHVVETLANPSARRVDLQGRTVVPGFNDCHCHILSFGLTLEQLDVGADSVRTIEDIRRAVRLRAQQTPREAWVIGRGYDQNVLRDRRHPTRSDLDAAAPDHAVVLWHTSGHALTANSVALRAAGVTTNTPIPPGGDIEHDEHGEPTGVLKEAAGELVANAIPPPSAEEGAEAIIRAMSVMARQGITSASDASTGDGDSIVPELEMYRRALVSGRLSGRITLMPQIHYVAPPGSDASYRHEEFDAGDQPHWLRVGPTKIFSDGALTTRTAAVRRPYADTTGTGILMWERDELESMIGRAHSAGWQIATHAIGDRAVETVLACYERALSRAPRPNHRHRIEHCMMVDRDLAARIRQLGVVPTVQPGFVGRLGDAYVAGLGMERASQLMPLALFQELGIRFAFSSDRPVIPGAPLTGMHSAMRRTTPAGVTLGQEHRVTALDAVRHYTVESAFATRSEGHVGTLREGILADFVVLSRDPTDLPPDEFAGVQVEKTVVGGVETFGE